MMENTATKLLAILMFCALFSVKTSKCMEEKYNLDAPGGGTPTETETAGGGGLEYNEPLTVTDIQTPDVVAPEEVTTEEVTTEEVTTEETPTVEETTGDVTEITTTEPSVETPARKKRKISTTRAEKKAKKAGRKAKGERTKPRKAALTAKGARRPESEIEKLAKFDENGNIESFNTATEKLTKFIKGKRLLDSGDKTELYAALAKFRFILGSEGFDKDDHYEAVEKLLTAATDNLKLFNKYQIRHIKDWKESTEKEKVDPTLRKKQTAAASVRKQARKRDIGPVSGPQRKAARSR